MKNFKFLLVGMLFGFVFVKSQVISFFRIQEMFLLQSFHMYGLLMSAVVTIAIGLIIMKRLKMKNLDGELIQTIPIELTPGNAIGGIIFGVGWAMTGACPGPIYTLLGSGYLPIAVALFGALTGTLLFGLVEKKLP